LLQVDAVRSPQPFSVPADTMLEGSPTGSRLSWARGPPPPREMPHAVCADGPAEDYGKSWRSKIQVTSSHGEYQNIQVWLLTPGVKHPPPPSMPQSTLIHIRTEVPALEQTVHALRRHTWKKRGSSSRPLLTFRNSGWSLKCHVTRQAAVSCACMLFSNLITGVMLQQVDRTADQGGVLDFCCYLCLSASCN